jgi:hypothetical protein
MILEGRPRSASNRAKASNGEVVNTPPKSQITASTIFSAHANAGSDGYHGIPVETSPPPFVGPKYLGIG